MLVQTQSKDTEGAPASGKWAHGVHCWNPNRRDLGSVAIRLSLTGYNWRRGSKLQITLKILMKSPGWPAYLSCRVDAFRARFQPETWAVCAGASAESARAVTGRCTPSSEDIFALGTETAHCGPHILPLSRNLKRPWCMSFQKMCNIETAGLSLCIL